MKKSINFLISVASLFTLIIGVILAVYFLKLPDDYYVIKGEHLKVASYFEIDAVAVGDTMQSAKSQNDVFSEKMTLKLFGIIPIKDVTVESVEEPLLIPGGNPFGIKLLADGVMVIGIGEIKEDTGIVSPAAEAGIKIGDFVVSVNGEKVISNGQIAKIIKESDGKDIDVVFIRDEIEMHVRIKPAFSLNDNCYKAGMYVRDSTAGIGTVTFYNPATGAFGGLGHPVCDVDTGELIPLSSGEVVDVNIDGVNKGKSGTPGELIGSFVSTESVGSLEMNSECGLFGFFYDFPLENEAIPMALRQEIQTGKATIYTTIYGNTPQEYEIEIEKIDLKADQQSKNMIIRITDKRLLEKTGGIVQGMSGSPILQNGKIIGAVTHVFVNNPEKGYGIFCDTMYDFSQNIEKNGKAA